MLDRLQFRVQPIGQICKRMRRRREMKQREQGFAKMVCKAWGKAEKKNTIAKNNKFLPNI